MISIIITTYKEPRTLFKAVQAILNQNLKQEYEILVVGPDKETEDIVSNFSASSASWADSADRQIRYLKDRGVGKPAALNLAFKSARGNILVLTDGDVWMDEVPKDEPTRQGSLKYLLEPFENPKVGAVSGRPISTSSRDNLFGYWSHFLTEAAHRMRLTNRPWPCSGYLYAVRYDLLRPIPEDMFSEDAVITQMIRNQNYQVIYKSEAKIYVKYPDNFQDWILQKKRAVGGYIQKQSGETRSLWQEIKDGIKLFFTYPRNLKEFWWIILLFWARIYLWLLIFWEIKIKKEKFANVWRRVESTK